MSWSLSAGSETRVWKQRGFFVLLEFPPELSVLSRTGWDPHAALFHMQRGWAEWAPVGQFSPVPAQLWGNTSVVSPELCAALPCARCCEAAGNASIQTLTAAAWTHSWCIQSTSPNRAMMWPYAHNHSMKWKAIEAVFLLMANRAVGISTERKISQQEHCYGGLCCGCSIYANYM